MASIYVGTYAKYNAGNLFGAWFNLEYYDSLQEFLNACVELHNDEDDVELMFQDHEGIPDSMISESHIDSELWEYLGCSADEGAKEAYMERFDDWDERLFLDRYLGRFDSWKDMTEELLKSTGDLNQIPEKLRCYFNYDAYALDMRLSGDMWEHHNHFFRNN